MLNAKKIPYKQIIIELLLLATVLLIDLLSKSLVFSFLADKPNHEYVVIDGIYTLKEAHNYGASFGIFEGKQGFLVTLTALAMLGFSVLLVLKPRLPKILRCALILVVGGGIGNLVDRIAFGYVRDFIDYTFLYTFFKIDFAIGNIADIFLLVGVFMMIIYVCFVYQEGDFGKKKDGETCNECVAVSDEMPENGENNTVDMAQNQIEGSFAQSDEQSIDEKGSKNE